MHRHKGRNRFFEDKKAELPENSPAFFSG